MWDSRGMTSYAANWHSFRGGWGEDWQVGGKSVIPKSFPDGTSNTIMVGSKALATQMYGQRGSTNYTASNGASQSGGDNPITDPGNERVGTTRGWGPDVIWYIAGANPNPLDPANPYKTDIPGSRYRFDPGHNWYYQTFAVRQDIPDQDVQNVWGSPYPGSAPMAFADGSVRGVGYSITFSTLIPLLTPTGGEVVTLD